jgi:hypothetical protein
VINDQVDQFAAGRAVVQHDARLSLGHANQGNRRTRLWRPSNIILTRA